MFRETLKSLLDQYPEAVCINLGCGFDDKFSQVDNGKLRWFDVDLPDQIAVRRKVYEDRDRCIMMDGDALDGYWTSSIPKADSGYNRSDNKKSPAGSLITVMIIPAGFLN